METQSETAPLREKGCFSFCQKYWHFPCRLMSSWDPLTKGSQFSDQPTHAKKWWTSVWVQRKARTQSAQLTVQHILQGCQLYHNQRVSDTAVREKIFGPGNQSLRRTAAIVRATGVWSNDEEESAQWKSSLACFYNSSINWLHSRVTQAE